jgi:processive 1,2-diacylglycerol beta-glucosyltransferase
MGGFRLNTLTVLILTSKFENNPTARVLADDLFLKGFNPIISDLFGQGYPVSSDNSQALTQKKIEPRNPSFYKWFSFYYNKFNPKGLIQFSKYLGRKRLMELIEAYHPVFIISTFPLHTAPNPINKITYNIPIYSVLTDYTLNSYWINPVINHYFVSSEQVKNQLIKQQINESQITISGIPIPTQFEVEKNNKTLFQKYLLSSHKKIITVLADEANGINKIPELCSQLIQNPSYQIIAVCGNNEKMYEKLLPIAYCYPNSFRLLGNVEKYDELFAITNILITKPILMTLAEAAAAKVPLILLKSSDRKETENAKHFVKKRAALFSKSSKQTLEIIRKLLGNQKRLDAMKQSLSKIHVAKSVATINNYGIEQANQSLALKKEQSEDFLLVNLAN